MAPEPRPIPRFVAEPPHEGRPYGRWAESLARRFLEACEQIEADEDLGEPGEVVWFPDRTFAGRTYVPASATTSTGFELLGFVSYTREHDGAEARDFESFAGGENRRGEIALVWGVALVDNGALATAELGPTTVDQCQLMDDRFTLVALDNYTGDFLDVKLWGQGGGELATESLYEDE